MVTGFCTGRKVELGPMGGIQKKGGEALTGKADCGGRISSERDLRMLILKRWALE